MPKHLSPSFFLEQKYNNNNAKNKNSFRIDIGSNYQKKIVFSILKEWKTKKYIFNTAERSKNNIK